jgi:hypothetical protein
MRGMKAILRTYQSENLFFEEEVEIDDDHIFAYGPYQDTVPFAVSSNQEILPIDG